VKFPNISGLLREDLWTSRLDIPAKIALSSLIFSEAPDSANLILLNMLAFTIQQYGRILDCSRSGEATQKLNLHKERGDIFPLFPSKPTPLTRGLYSVRKAPSTVPRRTLASSDMDLFSS
jgi:hypothetical protein